jgi:zinc protease
MRRHSVYAILLILALGIPGCQQADKTGENAMHTILLPSPESPLIDFRIEFRVGSIHEPAGKEGLNELTAQTVAAGGTEDLTYEQVLEKLYPMAAAVQVQPGKEVTVFFATVHRDNLEAFWEIFSNLLLKPRFDENDFARNKDLQINYLKNVLRSTADEELGKVALEDFIYEDHPYGHPIAGRVKALEGLTLKDVQDFYRTHYLRSNVVIGLAGGYPKEFPQMVSDMLSTLPEGKVPEVKLPAPKPFQGIHVEIIEKPASATAISFGYPIGINRSSEDFVALFLANSYLGEHRTFKGQLMRHMRGDRGLNYGDYSYAEHFEEEPGTVYPLTNVPRRGQYFSVWIRPVAPQNAQFSLRAAVRRLEKLVSEGMTEEEFQDTRGFLLGYTKLWGQSASRRLGYALDADFYGIDRDYLGMLDRKIRALTLEDVNRVIRKHLQARNLKVVMVAEDAESLRKALVSDAPSPITYDTPKTPEVLAEDKEIIKYPLRIAADAVEIIPATEMFQ